MLYFEQINVLLHKDNQNAMNSKTSKMNIIILSGGSGKRLWPLSNSIRSKQFLKILSDEEGKPISMIQRIYRQLNEIDAHIEVTVAATKAQEGILRNQLGESAGISTEPSRRDTMAAIMLAAAYLHDVRNVPDDEVIIVMPADVYTEESYFYSLIRLHEIAESKKTPLCLMGIEPTEPSEKYGYIIPESGSLISTVKKFKEKPDKETAEQYIAQGALWNCGVFAFCLSYIREKTRALMGFNDYETLYENYNDIPKTSFDYGIVEKENAISVLRYCGDWMDLGTWNTFTGAMSTNTYGNSIQEECVNTHLINELEMPVLALGIHGTVVAASPDGIIVADKDSSSKLKQYIDRIELRPMYEERIWGTYRVLSMRTEDPCSITKELIIRPGKDISYQKHHKRSENWTIIQGTGQVVINGIIHSVKRGDSVMIKEGMLHAIRAVTELHIIEVQIGSELTEEDIERFDWCWDQ